MSDPVADLAQRYLDLTVEVMGYARTNKDKLLGVETQIGVHDAKLETLIAGLGTRLDVLTEETRLLRHALEAKNSFTAKLFLWLEKRWMSVLVGLGFGLGLAGAKELVQALLPTATGG